jgi:alpha-L-fucosidase
MHEHNPHIIIWSAYASESRGVGNEEGFAGDPCWSKMNSTDMRARWDRGEQAWMRDDLTRGCPEGDIWNVAEVDLSLEQRGWWFWRPEQNPRLLEELVKVYFTSVAVGQVLNINLIPDRDGWLTKPFADRILEFGDAIRQTFADDLCQQKGVKARASSTWGGESSEYGASNVLALDPNKFWGLEENATDGWIEVDFGHDEVFDIVVIQEYIQLGQRIKNFRVDVYVQGVWRQFADSNTIGYKRIIRTHPTKASRIRFNFTSQGFFAVPLIVRVSAFLSKSFFSLDEVGIPDGLSLTGYGHFNPGQVVDDWVDEEDTFKAVKTNGTLTTKIERSCGLWVIGTKDPSYGTLEVYMDGQLKGSVDCYAPKHQTRQLLFHTYDVHLGKHSVSLHQVGSKPVAFRAIYTLRSNRGMWDFMEKEYHVMAGDEVVVDISRVLGQIVSNVLVQAWPDTALPGEDYEDVAQNVRLISQQNLTNITVKTIRPKKWQPEEKRFTLRLSHPGPAIVGFNYSTTIIISPGPPPATSPSLSPSPSHRSKSLSKAAIGGIAGGASVVLIVAVVVSVLVLRKQKSADGLLLTISEEPMVKR